MRGGIFIINNEKAVWAVEQLVKKYEALGRIPKKEDFDDSTRARIKAFLGPWPRALETAGLKERKTKNKGVSKKSK